MKANELRIGNYVYPIHLDGNAEVIEVSIQRVGVKKFPTIFDTETKFQFILTNDLHRLEPIPLTEEWLVRFRFKNKKVFYTISKLGIIEIKITLMQKHHEVYYTRHGVEEVFIRTIKSVHQLQNLYFALVGEELEVI